MSYDAAQGETKRRRAILLSHLNHVAVLQVGVWMCAGYRQDTGLNQNDSLQ